MPCKLAAAPRVAFSRSAVAHSTACKHAPLFAGPEDEEEKEGGLDLDLGEMFEMFDAADKGEDFDEAIGKVKGGDNDN